MKDLVAWNQAISRGARRSARATLLICGVALAGTMMAAVPAFGAPPAGPTALSPSSVSLQFGPQDMHSQSTMQENYFNDTSSPTTVQALTITGPDASSFSIPSGQDFCSGQTIPASSECSVQVIFEGLPGGPGAQDATLELVDDTPETVDVPLSGTAITGTLSLNQTSLGFGAQVINQGNSEQQSVTVSNGPNASVIVHDQQITGPDASSFSVEGGGCVGFTLGSGNTCQIYIQFQPTSAGSKHAQLEIDNDGTATPLFVSLTGTGLNGPTLSINPPQAIYGNVTLGSRASQTFTLSNTGDAPLQIQGLFLIAGSPQAFPISNNGCTGRQVAAGSSCQVTVGFIPIAPGVKDASLLLITNASNPGVSTIGLSGTGLSPAPAPTGTAKVVGIAQAGKTLTCSTSYPAGTQFSYQWLRAGRSITSATARTLALGNADVGARLSCRVQATGAGGSQTVTSPATGRALPELTVGKISLHGFTITTHVTVSGGTLRVAEIITNPRALGPVSTRTRCKPGKKLAHGPRGHRCVPNAFGISVSTHGNGGTYTINLSPYPEAKAALSNGRTLRIRATLTLGAADGLGPIRKTFNAIVPGANAPGRWNVGANH